MKINDVKRSFIDLRVSSPHCSKENDFSTIVSPPLKHEVGSNCSNRCFLKVGLKKETVKLKKVVMMEGWTWMI